MGKLPKLKYAPFNRNFYTPQTANIKRRDWQSGSSGRAIASLASEFKPQYHQKKKRKKNLSGEYLI
jgi:hypothetical protein